MSDHPTSASRSSLRALEIFDAFRAARRPLSLSELARITEIPVSTCHGVLRALEQRGFLYHLGARDVYPTRRLWDLADELRAHDPVARRLEPGLVALRDETTRRSLLGTRQGDAVSLPGAGEQPGDPLLVAGRRAQAVALQRDRQGDAGRDGAGRARCVPGARRSAARDEAHLVDHALRATWRRRASAAGARPAARTSPT